MAHIGTTNNSSIQCSSSSSCGDGGGGSSSSSSSGSNDDGASGSTLEQRTTTASTLESHDTYATSTPGECCKPENHETRRMPAAAPANDERNERTSATDAEVYYEDLIFYLQQRFINTPCRRVIAFLTYVANQRIMYRLSSFGIRQIVVGPSVDRIR